MVVSHLVINVCKYLLHLTVARKVGTWHFLFFCSMLEIFFVVWLIQIESLFDFHYCVHVLWLLISQWWHENGNLLLVLIVCCHCFCVSCLLSSFPWMHLCKPIKDVPKVGDLSFVDFTDTTIGIKWTPLNYPAVTGYHITVVTASQSFPILEDMVNSSVNYYTIRGLEPGINYEISVSTITDEAESVPSVITQQTQTGELSHIGLLLHFGGWE